MAQLFIDPIARIFTNAGLVGVGYKYYFYATGTTTPVTTYQNEALTVPNTNPVVSDSNGRFPKIYYSDLSQLKLVVKDQNGNVIEGASADPVGTTASAVSLNDFDVRPTSYWGLTGGTSIAYTLLANPPIPSYDNVQTFVIQPHLDCGDNPTLAVSGLSALSWKKYTQQGTKVAMKANDLRAGQRYFCVNDGVDIICLNPSSLPILSGSATALTIATGTVTLTNNSSSYVLDTEGSASTDDLDTISAGQDGQIILLNIANNSRDITIRSGVGNIVNPTGLNITLGNTNDVACLRYNGTNWIVQYFNYSDAEPIRILETKIVSSVGEVIFSNNINSIFSSYEIRITDAVPSTNAPLQALLSVDNGATFLSSGYRGVSSFIVDGISESAKAASTSLLEISYNSSSSQFVQSGSSNGITGVIKLLNPNSSANKHVYSDLSWSVSGGAYGGGWTKQRNSTALSISGIKIFFLGATMSGKLQLVGIK